MKHLLHKLSSMRLLMLLAVLLGMGSSAAWADTSTSTLTFTTKCNGSGTADDGASWTVTSDGTESNFDEAKGIHYGTGSAQVQYIRLSTSDIPGTITEVVVNASTASGVSATASVTVGGNAFGGDPQSLSSSAANYTFTGSASGEIVVTVTKPSKAAKAIYVKSVVVTYTTGGGDTPTLENNDLALTDDPVDLEFDLYNNSNAQVINYTTSSTGAVTIANNDYASFDIDEENLTITVTPTAVTPETQTITINQAADDSYMAGSTTFTLTISDSTPIPTHTATFSVNGETTSDTFEEGAAITFPANPGVLYGKTFVGWVADAIDGTTNEAPEFVTSATMGNSDVTYYAVFALASGGSAEIVDKLDNALTGVSVTTYTSWSNKTDKSSAVYAGQSAGSYGSIQLRSSNNNSGVVTTSSGGNVKKVTVAWNSNTAAGRTLNVYGKHSAYSDASDLYNGSKQGTLLGSIGKGTTEFTIDGNYEYIGFCSASGALYLDEVQITWSTGGGVSYSDYCTTVVAATVEKPVIEVTSPFTLSTEVTMSCSTEGATIYYTLDESEPTSESSEYTAPFSINATTTIKAIAIKGSDESEVTTVTATKNLAEPTLAIDATGITNTNVFDGTEAGSLAAAVTYNDAAVEGAIVTWSGDNDEVATIDDETGAVTLVAAGSVTFTATYAGNSDYSEKTETYVMTVTNTDPNAPGTENNPYSVAQAIENTPASGSSANVYIKGIVSAFYGDDIMGDGSNYRYYISDDGTTTNQLLVYKGKGLDEETFSSADDLLIGDVVTILGGLTLYKGASEVASGNYLTTQTRPTVTITTNNDEYGTASLNGRTVTAAPNSGYRFADPKYEVTTGSATVVDNGDNTFTLSNILDDCTIQFNFEAIPEKLPNSILYVADSYNLNIESVGGQINLAGATATHGTLQSEIVSASTTVDESKYLWEDNVLLVEEGGNGIIVIRFWVDEDEEYHAVEQIATVTVSADPVIAYADAVEETVYGTSYVVDADLIKGGDITLTSSNTDVATVGDLTITPQAVGTTTITINTAATEIWNAGEATFTLTVTAPEGLTTAPSSEATYTFDFTDNTDWQFPTSNTTEENEYTKDGKTITLNSSSSGYKYNSGALLLGKSGATLTLPAFDKPVTKITTEGKSGASAKVTFNIFVDDDAVSMEATSSVLNHEFEIDSEYQGVGTIYTLKVTNANNIQIPTLTVYMSQAPSETVTLNKDGYATYCSVNPMDFSSTVGYTAWSVSSISNDGTITFSKITEAIKGGQGVLLYNVGADGKNTTNVTVNFADSEAELTGNLLIGTTAPKFLEIGEVYGLKGSNFVINNADGVINAGKAYIKATDIPAEVKSFTFVFEDETTGITETRQATREEVESIFNLGGQRMSRVQRGVNIVNGKKVFVR